MPSIRIAVFATAQRQNRGQNTRRSERPTDKGMQVSDLKSVVSAIRTGMDIIVELGTFKGVLFLCGLAAFLDAASSYLHVGNLVTLDWSVRVGPGILLLSFIVYLGVQFIGVPLLEELLVRTLGGIAVKIRHGNNDDASRDGFTAQTLADLAKFEDDEALAEEVSAARTRWAAEAEEADRLMRLSLVALIWSGIAFLEHDSAIRSALGYIVKSGHPYLLMSLAFAGVYLAALPWLFHLSTDPYACRRIFGPFSLRVEAMRRAKLGLPPEKPVYLQ